MNYLYGLSAISLIAANTAFAQYTPVQNEPRTELKEIVVSGGLSPIELRKSGRSISVIDGETLEKNQVKYAVDALRLLPGVHVSRSGSTGGQTVVRLRGSEANQLLVVIDGVPMNDVDQGAAYFENLLASDIEQIEVLRGPQSALWGSNAMSGVINITTKSGEAGKPQSSIMTEVGSNKSWLTNLSTRGGTEAVRYALSGSFNRVNGFNIAKIGDEDDRDRNATINGKLALDLSESTTLDTSFRLVNRKSDYDDTSWIDDTIIDADNFLTERTRSLAANLTNTSMDDRLTQKLYGSLRDQSRDSYDSWGGFLSDSNRYIAGYNASYLFDGIDNQSHRLTGGYEWLRETYQSNYMDGEAKRSSHSAIAEYRGEFDERYFLTAGIRHDWNSHVADATTWNISGDWKISEHGLRLHSAIGTAVTKPTFYEQFANSKNFVGNPNLTPEKSFGWDIGIEKSFMDGGLIVDATYFNQNLTNEISGAGNSVVNNAGESERQGIELSAKLDFFNGFTTTASYTYTDATSQKLNTDPRLAAIRRPRHSGGINTAYAFADNHARIFAEVILNGEMPDEGFNIGRTNLGGYTVVNIGASYQANETLEVFGRVENLFDKSYTEVYGYNTAGITGFAGLRAKF